MKRKTLFKHNGQTIYSIDCDLYQTEMENLINYLANEVEAKPEEIELCYEELTEVMQINYQAARNLFYDAIKSLRKALS